MMKSYWKKQIYKKDDEILVTIGLYNETYDLYLVSPISSFIFDTYGRCKTSTKNAAANVIVMFMNYIRDNNIDLLKLTYDDGIQFLNTRSSNQTRKQYSRYLVKFYKYLHQHEIINENIDYDNLTFDGYVRTQTRKQDCIHNINLEYLPLFLQCAKDVAPDIAFGIFLEIFGGLRCSEVVSLEYSNITISNKDSNIKTMYVSIKDKDLRPDLQTAFINQAKKNRRQEIIPAFGNMLFDLFDEHKKKYKVSNTMAIFIDKNGNAMTSRTYSKRFNKVKREFIKRLSSSMDINAKSYGVYLSTYKWSTHICRGIFSNLIANNSSNISEIAAWRGDSSLSSSLAYLNDSETVMNKVLDVLNNIYKE